MVHDDKGQKSRRTMLPESIRISLQEHLQRVQLLHEADMKKGCGRVVLPNALAHKYPNAERAWEWQYAFPRKDYAQRRGKRSDATPPHSPQQRAEGTQTRS